MLDQDINDKLMAELNLAAATEVNLAPEQYDEGLQRHLENIDRGVGHYMSDTQDKYLTDDEAEALLSGALDYMLVNNDINRMRSTIMEIAAFACLNECMVGTSNRLTEKYGADIGLEAAQKESVREDAELDDDKKNKKKKKKKTWFS